MENLTEQLTIATLYSEFTLEMQLQRYLIRNHPYIKFWSFQCTWNPKYREEDQVLFRNYYIDHLRNSWILPLDADMIVIGNFNAFLDLMSTCEEKVIWIPIYDKDMTKGYFPAVIFSDYNMGYVENHHNLRDGNDKNIYSPNYPHKKSDLLSIIHLGEYYK